MTGGNINSELWSFHFHPDKDSEKVLKSESGLFLVNENGIVQSFEPSNNNPIFEEKTEIEANYTFKTYKSIRTFIVPEGVKGFVLDFIRGLRVSERFELPDSLLSIGYCNFADCILPDVAIPQNVREICNFAFGHSHIDILQLPSTLQSPYGRQFKDSYIGTLRLPTEWKDYVALDEYNCLRPENQWVKEHEYGYLGWPSTYIENLKFY